MARLPQRGKFYKREYMAGFTIVELLIVIVVIGILAAITIVAFNGIQNRANTTAVQSDLTNLDKKMKLFYADNSAYPATVSQLNSLSWKASMGSYQQSSAGNLLYCAVTDGPDARYTVAARTSNNTAFTYSSQGGLQSYTGAWTGAWSTDCPLFGYTITPTVPSNFSYSQGYHPPGWGSPGWKIWTGGTI